MAARAKKPVKKAALRKVIKEKVTAEGPVEIVVNVPEDMEVKSETTTTSESSDTGEEEKSQVIVKKDEEDSVGEDSENIESEKVEKESSEDSEKEDDDGEGISFKKILLWTISIVLFFSAVGILGAFVYQLGFRTGEETMQKKIESMSTPTPEVTPTPDEAAKDEFTIEILNGSGISGEAGRAQVLLEDEGFTVSGIGNADNSDYTETVISSKENVSSEWLSLLKKSLQEAYVVSSGDELSSDAETDVVITVGSSKPE